MTLTALLAFSPMDIGKRKVAREVTESARRVLICRLDDLDSRVPVVFSDPRRKKDPDIYRRQLAREQEEIAQFRDQVASKFCAAVNGYRSRDLIAGKVIVPTTYVANRLAEEAHRIEKRQYGLAKELRQAARQLDSLTEPGNGHANL